MERKGKERKRKKGKERKGREGKERKGKGRYLNIVENPPIHKTFSTRPIDISIRTGDKNVPLNITKAKGSDTQGRI